MLVIGLTGGIGSGKTTVAQLFKQHRVEVFSADEIARQLVETHPALRKKIIHHFGDDFLMKDGHVDRQRLRDYVFQHPDAKQWLEALLHPLIRKQLRTCIAQAQGVYCIVDIPLLVETGPYPEVNRILVVDIPENRQIQRVHQRDKQTPQQIQQIMATQASRAQRLALANDTIDNSGSQRELCKQVAALHAKYTIEGQS